MSPGDPGDDEGDDPMSEQAWPIQMQTTAPRTIGVDADASTRWVRRASVVVSILAAAMLLASVPAMSGAPSSGAKPSPMPAPAPSIVTTDIGQR
jgi:hypothetical protein